MATDSDEKLTQVYDLSGAVQRKSSQFMRVRNQQELGVNASYERIGAVGKVLGYTQIGNTITTSTSTSTSTSSTTSTSTSTSSTTTP